MGVCRSRISRLRDLGGNERGATSVSLGVQELLLERLALDDVDDGLADLVLAACDGPASLESALVGGVHLRSQVDVGGGAAAEPPGVFLAGVRVAGFRGIGPAVSLAVEPGPGLTLVVGRNGSGKSSLAEALEVLLTGDTARWRDRREAWRAGWRNLHHPSTAIEARFLVEGRGDVVVRRAWLDGEGLADGEASDLSVLLQAAGPGGSAELMSRYRPFLSYSELGTLLEGQASLHDGLASVLGLEDVVAVEQVLRDARRSREEEGKQAAGGLRELQPLLLESGDERAVSCRAALADKAWDLDRVELALDGVVDGGDPESDLAALRALASLQAPEPGRLADVAAGLRAAEQRLLDVAGTDAARAYALAGLLEQALTLHAGHGDGDCPVCGAGAALDGSWRHEAEQEFARLRGQAEAATEAERAAGQAVRAAELLHVSEPASLAHAAGLGLDAAPVHAAWSDWLAAPVTGGLGALADHLERAGAGLTASVGALRVEAERELARREDAWRPLARGLTSWLPGARRAQMGAEQAVRLKKAEEWVKGLQKRLREERFAPIRDEAQAIWSLLRQGSNVSIGRIELAGASTQRRVEIDVTVDDQPGAALGVMSQGELHALALSLFLPRACLPESPFRFIVIDDPVQSMDPAKVDGLARALARSAERRQVLVFTHDERLPEAVRRLRIAATVLEVTRRPGSVVEIRRGRDPVEQAIADARAVARDPSLDLEIAGRVVPGFLRAALEAACTQCVRRRRLARGEGHADVEELLLRARTTYSRVALALFDDAGRAGDVTAAVGNRFNQRALDALRAATTGAHDGVTCPLEPLIQDAARLATDLRDMP